MWLHFVFHGDEVSVKSPSTVSLVTKDVLLRSFTLVWDHRVTTTHPDIAG